MSGCSSNCPCPNCGADADEYIDWKPYNYTVITCYSCGLQIYPTLVYADLEELNAMREEQDCNMEPLTVLPKQNKDL